MTISAQIIADSLSPHGKRLTSVQLKYPRFIHSELMTHRAFSRNASSSRAIPVPTMIDEIIRDTAMPTYWGANQKGMQAGEEIDAHITLPVLVASNRKDMYGFGEFLVDDSLIERPMGALGVRPDWTKEEAWNDARDFAIAMARGYHAAGYHKQIVNRLLEPFMHINVLVSATEWDNFFHLRDHADAEPHIQELARKIKIEMGVSEPKHLNAGEWHLPYVSDYLDVESAIAISVARSARVSYLTHDGRETTAEEDLALYERLVGSAPLHASPTEHQAEADDKAGGNWISPHLHGNFVGWNQYRKTLKGENYSSEPTGIGVD